MHHSSTDPNNDGTIDVEYGDTSDIMGYGGVGWRQINAPHKEEMGWLPSSKYQAVTAAGTYSIAPTELAPTATSLPQALKIPRADGGYYYISYRQPIGYDASMRAEYANRATIHHWNGVSATQTMLITTLTDGGSWSNLNGTLTVRQVSHSADAVTVEVSFQCAGQAPSVTLSPTSKTGKAGALATYSVSVVNNDGAPCPATAFNLTGSAPANWSASVSPGAITLSPGQSGSATLSVTSPPDAASGSYPVGANVSDGALPIHNAAGSATYVVDSSPPTTPTNLKASVKTRSVTLSWTASSDNIGVTGYEVYRNNGLLATATGTTYKDTTVKRGTTYIYFVKARDAAGNVSGQSNTITVTAR